MNVCEVEAQRIPEEVAGLPRQEPRDGLPLGAAEGERRWGWFEAAFLAVLVAALGLRLFELSGRPMHYDEAIHLHYAWRLASSAGALFGWPWIFGTDYVHSAWMHGPFQIEMAAAIFTIFGDTDFTSRLGYALFGTALVGLPYFLRNHIGRRGALIAAVLLALSPALLYFGRFGRNDIIMMFWAVALFTLMWRYLHGGRRIHLYVCSAILALMFATKETAYLLVAIFGLILVVAVLPELMAWLREKGRLQREGTPSALLLLLITLTLPQWSAAVGIFQGLLGLTLANPDPLTGNHIVNADGSDGLTGAPAWQGGTLLLPVADVPWIMHVALVVVGLSVLSFVLSRGPLSARRVSGFIGAPVMASFATAWILFRPYAGVDPTSVVLAAADWTIFLATLVVMAGFLFWSGFGVRRAALMVAAPSLLVALYSLLFTPVLDVPAIVDSVLPGSASIGSVGEGVPLNYVVAFTMLAGALAISGAVGIWWLGRAWLVCAGIFYLIWTALYTTMFTNLSGIFTGFWQGMGYWIAQQDVARGNQPWYYYFVGLSVYELLPLAFGIAGIIYFFRKRDALGLALGLWAVLSLAAYTIATEKMPWLLVNLTTPLILVAAKYLGEVAGRIEWQSFRWRDGRLSVDLGTVIVFVLTPVVAVAAVYLFLQFVDPARIFLLEHWLLLATAVATAFVAALVSRLTGPGKAASAAGLGLAVLLLVFGSWAAFRAAYTYDDSNLEVLVYAQGSADVRETFIALEEEVFPSNEGLEPVKVDYDVWYPLQWYVRDHATDGRLNFHCFEVEAEENSSCIVLEGSLQEDGAYAFGNVAALVVKKPHVGNDADVQEGFRREGPFKELLWFPETYRRPDEDRATEPMHTQLGNDFGFFRDSVSSRESWASVLNYAIFRELDSPWFHSEYYAYLP